MAHKGWTGQADGQVGRGHTPNPFPGLPVNKFGEFGASGQREQTGLSASHIQTHRAVIL